MTLNPRPFDDLRAALQTDDSSGMGSLVRLDFGRHLRTGVPEVVYGRTKPAAEVLGSLTRLATANGRALASRCSADTVAHIHENAPAGFSVEIDSLGQSVVLVREGTARVATGGRVGIITAGSSDAPVAAEAAIMAREMGCDVRMASDCGVAGLHRLVGPLEAMMAEPEPVDVVVVVAGMDGALPTVVAGLVAVPVIGLPTSTGYGYGGDGLAALMTMLQACAPGVTVVNIDNGIGAGATAGLIANRVAAARQASCD